jgi:hypothetical protein
LREQAKDFRTGRPIDDAIFYEDSIDIHHVFPAIWCERQGIVPERANSILNKCPQTARTNRVIGGAPPSQYLPKLQKAYLQQQGGAATGMTEAQAAAAMDGLLRSHRIDPEHLRADAFDKYYENRRQELLGLISQVIGKTITAEQQPSTAEDALEQLDEGLEELPV